MQVSGLTPEQVVEFKHGLAGMAELTWTFYDDLKRQGFTDGEALRLSQTWLTAVMRGPFTGEPE